jgi:hypothetical protein
MYLYVFDDGYFGVTTVLSNGDFDSVEAGILDIIDIGDCAPKRFYNEGWADIEDIG